MIDRYRVLGCLISLAAVLCAGRASAEPGVTNTRITLGMSTALSGPAAFLGTNFKLGVEAYLNQTNDKGGVHGRAISLVAYDDGYEPNNTVEAVTKLIRNDGVFCLIGNVGTPTTLAIKQLLNDERVPLFAPFTGAEALRFPVDRYLLHYRASYNQEAEIFIRGMVESLGLKRIAVFHQDDGYGKAVLEGTKRALAVHGMKPAALGVYTRNYEDVGAALETIMSDKPDAVVMAGTYSACAKFITLWKRKVLLERKNARVPIFINVSFVGPDRLAMLLDKYGDGVVVTQVAPPVFIGGANYPAVTEYLAALAKYFPQAQPSFVSLEGFLAAKVFVEGLNRTGKNVTREGFIQAVEGIQNLDIGAGNVISFSPQNHQGSQTVYPTVIRGGKFQLIEDWKTVAAP